MDEIIAWWLTKTPWLSELVDQPSLLSGMVKILAEHSVKAYYTARRMLLPEKNLIANSCFTSFAIALARTSRAQQIMISRCVPRFGLLPDHTILKMLGF